MMHPPQQELPFPSYQGRESFLAEQPSMGRAGCCRNPGGVMQLRGQAFVLAQHQPCRVLHCAEVALGCAWPLLTVALPRAAGLVCIFPRNAFLSLWHPCGCGWRSEQPAFQHTGCVAACCGARTGLVCPWCCCARGGSKSQPPRMAHEGLELLAGTQGAGSVASPAGSSPLCLVAGSLREEML